MTPPPPNIFNRAKESGAIQVVKVQALEGSPQDGFPNSADFALAMNNETGLWSLLVLVCEQNICLLVIRK